jgi:hypothetical protein
MYNGRRAEARDDMSRKASWALRTTEWGRICWTCRLCGREYEQPRPPAQCQCAGAAGAPGGATPAPPPATKPERPAGLRLVDDDPPEST